MKKRMLQEVIEVKPLKKAILFAALVISLVLTLSINSSGIDFGNIRVNVEVSDSYDSLPYSLSDIKNSTKNNYVILGDKLLIPWVNYPTTDHYCSIVSPDGAVVQKRIIISPMATGYYTTIVYKALSNGNVLIFWYASSSGMGLTDTYFKILGSDLTTEVVTTTKINSAPGEFNWQTEAAELSNGDIAFLWSTTGKDYSLRRFRPNGTPVDASQISITNLVGTTDDSQYAHHIAASTGKFMITATNFSDQNFKGLLFDNASSSPIKFAGLNYFVIGSFGEKNWNTQLETLSNGKFLTVYVKSADTTSNGRCAYMRIYNTDGTPYTAETLIRPTHSWGSIYKPIIENGSFYLHYIDDSDSTAAITQRYFESYSNEGSYIGNYTFSFPALSDPEGVTTVFKDVGGNMTFLVNDREDAGPDYNTWLLRCPISVTPTVTWPTITAITYGQPFSNAMANNGSASYNSTPVSGTFTLQDAAAVPGVAGSPYSKTITFTPTNPALYKSVTQTVTITVNKATPTVTSWPSITNLIYGQPFSAALSGGSASVPGGFTIEDASVIPIVAGSPYTKTITFTPADTANYNSATNTVSVTVNKANQTGFAITGLPGYVPAYGDIFTLTTSGGGGTGAITWEAVGGASVSATGQVTVNGMEPVTITATKAGDANYNLATFTYSFTPDKATPAISHWPTISTITYGASFADAMANDGAASVAGIFSIEDNAVVPAVTGSPYSKTITFAPTDTALYKYVTHTVAITVNKATPTVTSWPVVSDITYGQPFSAALTGGSASVPGGFVIEDAAVVPGVVGSPYSKTVTFVPTDAANYNVAAQTVSVTVNKADATISDITCPDKSYDGNPLSPVTTVITGVGSVAYSYSGTGITGSTSTAPSTPGTYTITATLPESSNYNEAVKTKTVTISKANQSGFTITSKPGSTPTFGDVFTLSTSGGNGAGAVTWGATGGVSVTASGEVTVSGMEPVTITATKAGDDNYHPASDTYSFTPEKATPTISHWPTISTITYGATFADAMANDGAASVAGTFSIEDNAVVPVVTGSPYSKTITFAPMDTASYKSVTHIVAITVDKATPTVTSWPVVSDITYGQPFSAALSGGSASIPGSFVIEDAAVIPGVVGSPYSKTVTFVPTDTANYNITTHTVTVTVKKADAVISDITCPAKSYDGNPLSPITTIIMGTGSVVYSYSGTGIPSSTSTAPSTPGTYTITATLPESANYNEAVKTKTVTISKANQSGFAITSKPGSTPVFGDVFTLSTSGGNGAGAVTWGATGGASVAATGQVTVTGMEPVTITATKAGDDIYNPATDTYSFTPDMATPTISHWPTISTITFGAAFADAMANDGAASTAGTFTMQDALIVPVVAGSPYTKTITFIPHETDKYKNVTCSAVITVVKANAVISEITCSDKTYDGTPLSPTATIIKGEGSIAYTYTGTGIIGSTSTAPINAGAYTITAVLTESANYNATLKTKDVTISKADQTGFTISGIPGSTPAYGDVFTLGTSGGSGTGVVTWSSGGGASVTASGQVTVIGMDPVTITATKAGDVNYNPANDTYTFTPVKAVPTLGMVSATEIYATDTLDKSGLSRTDTSIAGTLAWETNAAFSSATAGTKTVTYSFTPTGADALKYKTLTGQSVNLTVNTRKILSISAQTAITNKAFGTVQGDLGLPTEINITAQGLTGPVTRIVPVVWSGYNAHTLSAQTLTGTIDLSGNHELNNIDSRTASISVTLQPLPSKNISDVSAKIKVGSTDGTDLLKGLVTSQFDGSVDVVATDAASWAGFPGNYNGATTLTQTLTVRVKFVYGYDRAYQDVIIGYDIVNPDSLQYTTPTITAIDATDARNATEAALLAYVNGYNALSAAWPLGAIGNTIFTDAAPAYAVLPKAYAITGTTYDLSQSYLGKTLTQSVTINEVKQDVPQLTIDYENETVNTAASMDYSTAPGVWNHCTADMPINSWLGSTVSFKTVAEGHKVDSDPIDISFPSRETAPTLLSAIINDAKTEATIQGMDTAVDYEYSLDGLAYSNLSADGKITIPGYQETIHVRRKFIVNTSLHSESAAVEVKYTMTFVTGWGSSISPAYAKENAAIPAPTPPTRSGYTFDGWYSSSSGSGSPIAFPYTITGNITAYALWHENPTEPTPQPPWSSSTTIVDNQTVTTFILDDEKLETLLQSDPSNTTVSIPVNTGADVVVGELNGQTIKNMETKDAVLEIKTESVTYTLPATQINIDNVSNELGEQVELKDINVSIKITEPSEETVRIVEETADNGNYQIVVKPVQFEITCTSGDKTVEVSKFNGYVERLIAIPEGIDPSKITTGIVLNNDGTFSHVPTTIVVIDGKYFARINSLTNSVYSVIYHPVEFSDVKNHEAREIINDMGSRLITAGVGNNLFAPDREVTRAEFVTILIKALGLRNGTETSSFTDVKPSSSYYDSIRIAKEYKIIAGYGNGKFGPNDKVTREQAMIMIDRAMKLTGLNGSLTNTGITNLLSSYTDASNVSGCARPSIAACLKNGIIIQDNSKTLAPKKNITRAQAAVIIHRLLQLSNLI